MYAKSRSSSTLTNARSTSWPIPPSTKLNFQGWILHSHTVDGSEIRHPPVEVGILSQYLQSCFTSLVVVWDFWTINSMTLQFEASNHWAFALPRCTPPVRGTSLASHAFSLLRPWPRGCFSNVSPSKNGWMFHPFFSNVGLTYTVPLLPSLDLLQVSKIRNEFAEGLQVYQLHSDPRSDLLVANPHNDW